MNLEEQVRETVLAELTRQSERAEQGLEVSTEDAPFVRIQGRVDLEALATAIIAALAGGP